jgi:hypothetical protein
VSSIYRIVGVGKWPHGGFKLSVEELIEILKALHVLQKLIRVEAVELQR